MASQQSAVPGETNLVRLVGRISASPEQRELPSGDLVCVFRVIVQRPPRSGGAPASVSVDTFDCAAWPAGLRRRVLGLLPGDVVTVQGELRRRFWRGPGGALSRVEVEVRTVRRMSRAASVG